ncbi:hypothetical protein GCM10022245_22910 [Streptomyces mayteni]
MPLAPELDAAVLVGWPVAGARLGFDGHPTTVYARADEARVEQVRAVLGATANPAAPNEVAVSRPSDAPGPVFWIFVDQALAPPGLAAWEVPPDAVHRKAPDRSSYPPYSRDSVTQRGAVYGVTAPRRSGRQALAARRATDEAFTGLLVGLGAVALLVGGVGVANTMVISVLERRAEIGLRRALGATRGQIRTQFLAESLLLSVLGGAGGTALGAAVTGGYALSRDWPTVVPPLAAAGGLAATLVIGGLAGLYPALRAARLSPTEALAVP